MTLFPIDPNAPIAQSGETIAHASPEEAALWAPILGECSAQRVRANILTASRHEIEIAVRMACDLPRETLGGITNLSDAQVAKHPAFLNRLSPEEVLRGNAIFAYAMRGNSLIGSVLAHRPAGDHIRHLEIGNLISDGSECGLGVPLVASLIVGESQNVGTSARAGAVARLLPGGEANIGSTKTFGRLGFYAAKVFTHPVTDRNPQKALSCSAEPNGAPLQYLRLKGDAEEIEKRAWSALKDWSLTFAE